MKRGNLSRGSVSVIRVRGGPSADNLNTLRYRSVDDQFQSIAQRIQKIQIQDFGRLRHIK